eukprot:6212974-Pleurochrysis_carterae.AAC.2
MEVESWINHGAACQAKLVCRENIAGLTALVLRRRERVREPVSGVAMRGVKGWSASTGEERSGASGESSKSSSRTRLFRSHAPTLSTQERKYK